MNTLLRDLRYSFRVLLKHKGFTAVAIVALGLGIGANTAIFSLVSGVLLRPLPFPDAERIVYFEGQNQLQGIAFALTRVIGNLLFSVGANDPTTFIAISFLLLSVSFVACYLPARRAAGFDPLKALARG